MRRLNSPPHRRGLGESFELANRASSSSASHAGALPKVRASDHQTSSADAPPESGMAGMGTFSPTPPAAALWLAGDEADFSTAVETHLIYLVSDSGLLACRGFSSGLAMNFFRTS